MKVRTPGGSAIQVEPFRKLGILPVSLPLGDALPAMQNRTIDGLISALAVFVNFKYYDITKSATYLPTTTILAPALINRRSSSRWVPSSRRSCARKPARRR